MICVQHAYTSSINETIIAENRETEIKKYSLRNLSLEKEIKMNLIHTD